MRLNLKGISLKVATAFACAVNHENYHMKCIFKQKPRQLLDKPNLMNRRKKICIMLIENYHPLSNEEKIEVQC